MSIAIEKHLKDVTVDNLIDFKNDSFNKYASARCVQLGVNGLGEFIIKDNNETYNISNPYLAIVKYKELVNQ